MRKPENTVLGRRYRDIVSEFVGIATGKAEYLDDPAGQTLLVARSTVETKEPEEKWFADSRLVDAGAGLHEE